MGSYSLLGIPFIYAMIYPVSCEQLSVSEGTALDCSGYCITRQCSSKLLAWYPFDDFSRTSTVIFTCSTTMIHLLTTPNRK